MTSHVGRNTWTMTDRRAEPERTLPRTDGNARARGTDVDLTRNNPNLQYTLRCSRSRKDSMHCKVFPWCRSEMGVIYTAEVGSYIPETPCPTSSSRLLTAQPNTFAGQSARAHFTFYEGRYIHATDAQHRINRTSNTRDRKLWHLPALRPGHTMGVRVNRAVFSVHQRYRSCS